MTDPISIAEQAYKDRIDLYVLTHDKGGHDQDTPGCPKCDAWYLQNWGEPDRPEWLDEDVPR